MANSNRGKFVWHELYTTDPKAAIAFYTEVVGWKTQPFAEAGDYVTWIGSQGPLGGVLTLPEAAKKAGAPPHWLGSVQVDDVDATARLASERGGKIYEAPSDVPTVGRYAIVADPQGAPLALFRPNGAMTLHDPSKEGEVCWNELLTNDVPAALAFYAELFGWKVLEEMDMGAMGKYSIYGIGDTRLGGMMTAPPGMSPAWFYYLGTGDVEAAIARATKRGAKVLNGPMDVPGGGRIAQLVDPQGAVFALHRGPKS